MDIWYTTTNIQGIQETLFRDMDWGWIRKIKYPEQDMKQALREVEEARDSGGKGENMWHVGRVPYWVLDDYGRRKGWEERWYFSSNQDEYFGIFLNDSDYEKFRVAKGRV